MTRLAILSPDPAFEGRAQSALPGADIARRWREEHLRIDPTKVVEELLDGGAGVACLGPGLPVDTLLDVAEAFDREHPEVCVVLVAERTPEVVDRALATGVRDIVPPSVRHEELARALARAAETAERRRTNLLAPVEPEGRSRVISVLSPKGGSGKTTVASNLAVALAGAASEPSSVAIVDLDLQFGDVAAALALSPEQGLVDVARSGSEIDATALKVFLTPHASGLFALCAPETPAEGDEIGYDHATHALRTLAASFHTVVVDTAAGLDGYTLAAIEQSTDLLFVCPPDVAAVRSLRKELDALDRLGMTAADRHLVLNRSDARVGIEPGDVENVLGMKATVSMPSSRAVPFTMNAGTPIVDKEPRSPVARSLQQLAARFTSAAAPVASAPAGPSRRLFRRDAR
jgi:pilus assembly protein CpaE